MSDNAHDKPDTPDGQGIQDKPHAPDSDTASGGSPDQPETTDPQGMPVDNPSGG